MLPIEIVGCTEPVLTVAEHSAVDVPTVVPPLFVVSVTVIVPVVLLFSDVRTQVFAIERVCVPVTLEKLYVIVCPFNVTTAV